MEAIYKGKFKFLNKLLKTDEKKRRLSVDCEDQTCIKAQGT